MGEIIAILKFDDELPTILKVQQQLQQTTSLEIQIEESDRHDKGCKWIIHFISSPYNYHTTIEIDWRDAEAYVNEGIKRVHMDNLNRCPRYSFFATVAALKDLGGQDEFAGNVPEYAKKTFLDWNKLNKGLTPAWWKQIAGWLLAGISFVFVGGAFALLFIVLKFLDMLLKIAGFFRQGIKVIPRRGK